jgi:uncharacterized protein YbjT (DUF2867 family)
MYAVIGATGHTGRVVAEALLAAGKEVRVLGRDAAKLQPLVHKGGHPIVGSLDDPGMLAKAFDGVRAVYAMIPPDFVSDDPLDAQRRHSEAIVGALRDMRVPACVHLSSVGAQNRSDAGPVSGLGRHEERLEAIPGLAVLHLRPAFFMENIFSFVPMMKQGFISTPMQPDLPMPWIATADIGAVAAEELLELRFRGHSTRELLGQRDLTWNEATPIIGKAIGKPDLRYVQSSYADAQAGLVQAGLKPKLAAAYVEMYRAINERRMKSLETRSDHNTTPTSLEAFVKALPAAMA